MRRFGTWVGPIRFRGATGDYLIYRLDAEIYVDEENQVNFGCAEVIADSSDERGDQNVNWEVSTSGSPVKRGHARTIRLAKAHAMVALRRALKIGHSPFTSRKRARAYGQRKRAW